MLLFKIGVVGEQIFFLLGVYRLSRLIYQNRLAVLAVGVAAAVSTVWYSNLHDSLRFGYMLPWVVYYVVLFSRTLRPIFLWWAGILGLMWWVVGSTAYHIIAEFWAVAVFAALLLCRTKGVFRALVSATKENILGFLAFLGLTVYFGVYYRLALQDLVFSSPGRDPGTGASSMESFLTYGGTADLGMLLRAFLFADPPFLPVSSAVDMTVYIGFLPFLFFLLAVVKCRDRLFFCLFLTTAFVALLSFGGALAKLCYHLPGMAYYRHLGSLAALVKVLVLLGSGYGVDEFLKWMSKDPGKQRVLAGLLLLAIFGDLMFFQVRLHAQAPRLPDEQVRAMDSVKVHQAGYQPVRVLDPLDDRQRQAWQLLTFSPMTAKYTGSFNFVQMDVCDPVYRMDLLSSRVRRLVPIPGVQRFLVGCYYPKMHLTSRAVFVPTVEEAAFQIMKIRHPSDPVVLRGKPPASPREGTEKGRQGLPQGGHVEKFTANELVARISVPGDGGWLVYADAFHPNWRATVNGKSVPVLEANLAFKAVALSAGENVVRFFYSPAQTAMTVVLALLGLGFGLLFCADFCRELFCEK